jgi:Holliday junction resolvasome RuvABC endonuclease subunit
MKKNIASPRMPPKCISDYKSVPISSFILGIVLILLRGLKSLKVLNPEIFFIEGSYVNKEAKTTVKSSQFQGS